MSMKIKYSYYSLRFSSELASLCFRFQEELDAEYIDLPFMLPTEAKTCEYRNAKIITFENEKYYIANKDVDIFFRPKHYLDGRFFGLINITDSITRYVFWANFYEEKIVDILSSFEGMIQFRIFENPSRISATLECGDINV